jgi:hypothetical protein
MSNSAKLKVQELARKIAVQDMDPILGCRAIVGMLRYLDERVVKHDSILTIRGIESETDDLPVGPERNNWEKCALAEKDREMTEYLAKVAPALKEACLEISEGRPWS